MSLQSDSAGGCVNPEKESGMRCWNKRPRVSRVREQKQRKQPAKSKETSNEKEGRGKAGRGPSSTMDGVNPSSSALKRTCKNMTTLSQISVRFRKESISKLNQKQDD